MSNQESDKIWESALERIEEEGLDAAIFTEMDLEYVYEYLVTGEIPDCYDSIGYRLYKA